MPYVGLDVAVMQGTTAALFDKLEGGEIGFDQSLEHAEGAGGQDSTIYSMIEPKGNVDTFLQTTGLLAKVTKAAVNGLPTVIEQIDGGVIGEDMRKQTSCYINSCKLSQQVGGAVKASFAWLALGMTTSAVTTAPAGNASGTTLQWVGATVELNSAPYNCQSWESNLENGLKLHTSLDAKTAGVYRMPEGITPGNEKVTFTAEFKSKPDVGLLVDAPAAVTLAVTAKNTEASPKTFTHTVVGKPKGLPVKLAKGEDEITWRIECEADYNATGAWAYTLS